MTFVAVFHSRDTIWMVTDRRLATTDGRVKTDKARKLLLLNAHDGQAIIGYGGLGATARGTEPSAWMSRVLRGRGGLSVEQSIAAIAAAMQTQNAQTPSSCS